MDRRIALASAVLACFPFAGTAVAQEYPNKPIRIIVPFAPGGATDVPTRMVAPKLAEALGQQVVVENRPGAGGIIGIEAAAKAPADGYTLLMATNAEYTMNPSIYAKLPYDPFKDFASISIVAETPMVLAVGAASPYPNLQALLAAARANPGTVSYSTAGTGSTSHVLTELLGAEAGVKFLHIPYKGGAPASAALASGEVAMSLIAMSSVLQFVRAGKAKVLGYTRPKRNATYPDWPTVDEAGVKGYDEVIWVGLSAPAGVPRAIVTRVAAETNKAMASADLRDKLAAIGSEAIVSSPDEMAARISREATRYGRIIRAANIKQD